MADDEYDRKFENLQQYIPFLESMIEQLMDPKRKDKEPQLTKMVSLHAMITDRKKKLKMKTLIKCEEVIVKLYDKAKSSGKLHLSPSPPSALTKKIPEGQPSGSCSDNKPRIEIPEQLKAFQDLPTRKPVSFSITKPVKVIKGASSIFSENQNLEIRRNSNEKSVSNTEDKDTKPRREKIPEGHLNQPSASCRIEIPKELKKSTNLTKSENKVKHVSFSTTKPVKMANETTRSVGNNQILEMRRNSNEKSSHMSNHKLDNTKPKHESNSKEETVKASEAKTETVYQRLTDKYNPKPKTPLLPTPLLNKPAVVPRIPLLPIPPHPFILNNPAIVPQILPSIPLPQILSNVLSFINLTNEKIDNQKTLPLHIGAPPILNFINNTVIENKPNFSLNLSKPEVQVTNDEQLEKPINNTELNHSLNQVSNDEQVEKLIKKRNPNKQQRTRIRLLLKQQNKNSCCVTPTPLKDLKLDNSQTTPQNSRDPRLEKSCNSSIPTDPPPILNFVNTDLKEKPNFSLNQPKPEAQVTNSEEMEKPKKKKRPNRRQRKVNRLLRKQQNENSCFPVLTPPKDLKLDKSCNSPTPPQDSRLNKSDNSPTPPTVSRDPRLNKNSDLSPPQDSRDPRLNKNSDLPPPQDSKDPRLNRNIVYDQKENTLYEPNVTDSKPSTSTVKESEDVVSSSVSPSFECKCKIIESLKEENVGVGEISSTNDIQENHSKPEDETEIINKFLMKHLENERTRSITSTFIKNLTKTIGDEQLKMVVEKVNTYRAEEEEKRRLKKRKIKQKRILLRRRKRREMLMKIRKREEKKKEEELVAVKKKKKSKSKSELDLLHEDINGMFIRDEIMRATGPRSCRLTKNAPQPETVDEKSKIALKNTPQPEAVDEKSNIALKNTPQPGTIDKKSKIALKNTPQPEKCNFDSKISSEELKEMINVRVLLPKISVKLDNKTVSGEEKEKSSERKRAKSPDVVPKAKRRKIEEEKITKQTEFTEPDKDYFCSQSVNFKLACKLCDFFGNNITRHYRIKHPESEVLSSRLRPDKAKQAIKDSLEFKLDETEEVTVASSRLYAFKCRFCDVEMQTTHSNFFDHISTHTGEYRHLCTLCSFSVSTRRALRNHCEKNHKKNYYPSVVWIRSRIYGYICLECNFVQTNRKTVENHVNVYHLEEGKKIMKIHLSTYDDTAVRLKNEAEGRIQILDEDSDKTVSEENMLVEEEKTEEPQPKPTETEKTPLCEDSGMKSVIEEPQSKRKKTELLDDKKESQSKPEPLKIIESPKTVMGKLQGEEQKDIEIEEPQTEEMSNRMLDNKNDDSDSDVVFENEPELQSLPKTTNIEEQKDETQELQSKGLKIEETEDSDSDVIFIESEPEPLKITIMEKLQGEEQKDIEIEESQSERLEESEEMSKLDNKEDSDSDVVIESPKTINVEEEEDEIHEPQSKRMKTEISEDSNSDVIFVKSEPLQVIESPNVVKLHKEGPPALSPLVETKPNHWIYSIIRAGFLNINKYEDGLEYVCRVPSCLFSTRVRDRFVSHWDEDHTRINGCYKMTKCKICQVDIKATLDSPLLTTFFTHVETKHLEAESSPPVLRIRRLSGDKLSRKEEEETEEENPFGIKIAGIVSLAENEKRSKEEEKMERVVLKEFKLSQIEKATKWKSKEAMKTFLECPEALYKCPQFFCKFATSRRRLFDDHITMHLSSKEQLLCCVYCDVKTPLNQASLHIGLRHSNCLYSCSKCLYRALKPEYVMVHMKNKHPNDDNIVALSPKQSMVNANNKQKKFSVKKACPPYKCGSEGCTSEFFFIDEYCDHVIKSHEGLMTCGYETDKMKSVFKCASVESLIDHYKSHKCYPLHCLLCKGGSDELYGILEHYSLRHPNKNPEVVDRRNSPKEAKEGLYYYYNDEAVEKVRRVSVDEILSTVEGRQFKVVPIDHPKKKVDGGESSVVPLDNPKSLNEGSDVESLGLTGRQLYRCAFCNSSFSNDFGFTLHFQQSKKCKKIKPLECVHCEGKFPSVTSLDQHIQYHGKLRFRCSLCINRFPWLHQLKLHLKVQHNVRNSRTIPVIPNKTNFEKDEFVLKQVSNDGPENVYQPYQIDDLLHDSTSSSEFKCAVCDHTTKAKASLVRHLQSHTETTLGN